MEEIIMKKICLLLAMLLCLVPVITACGANSSPEKAVTTALEVMYGDGDADPEDYWKVVYNYNLDLIELLDSDEASDVKESIRAAQKEIKGTLNQFKDIEETLEEEDIDDWNFSYEIIYCNTYEKGSDTFDSFIESFKYVDTDMEDHVTEVASVGVLLTYEYEKEKEDFTSSNVKNFTCYKIDGDWYIAA